jgi:hypothetical protein
MWGRRRAILVGSALNAAGFFSLLWADGFVDFLVYEIFLGVGFSLISGADLALLYDTEVYLQERGLPGGAGAGKSLSRLISVEAAASGIAGVVASILLLWSLDGVVLVQAFTGFMPLLLGLGVMFGFAIQASRGVSMSLFYEALNRRVPGEFRATVNSLVSLGVRSIFIVTGPVLGFALDSQGMSSTLLVLVAIFTPLMGLVLVPLVIRIRRESDSREMGLI